MKLSRPTFGFLTVVANAANAFLVPMIANNQVAAFTAAALNGAIVYFATESEQIQTNTGGSNDTQTTTT